MSGNEKEFETLEEYIGSHLGEIDRDIEKYGTVPVILELANGERTQWQIVTKTYDEVRELSGILGISENHALRTALYIGLSSSEFVRLDNRRIWDELQRFMEKVRRAMEHKDSMEIEYLIDELEKKLWKSGDK